MNKIKLKEKKAIAKSFQELRWLIKESKIMEEKKEFDRFIREACYDILEDANVQTDGGCPLCRG